MDVDELVSMTIESGRDRMSQNLISATRRDALVSMFSRLTGAVVVVGYDRPPMGFVTYTRLEYNDGSSVLSPFLCQIEQGQYRMAPFSGSLSALDSNLANGLKTNGFGRAVKISY